MEDSEIYKAIVAGEQDKALELIALATPEEIQSLRTRSGETIAHEVLQHMPNNADVLKAVVEKGLNMAIKNQDGKSPLEIILSTEEGASKIKDHIIKPILVSGDDEKLKQLLIAGWRFEPSSEDLEQMPEEIKGKLEELQQLQKRIATLHEAIQDGRLDDVKATEGWTTLVNAQNILGLPPLHEAVVYQNNEMVKHILSAAPDTINIKDNMNRTALHYAGGCDDSGILYNILVDAGADDTVKDLSDKTPAEVKAEPQLLPVASIKEKLEALLKVSKEKPETEPRPASSADRATEGEEAKAGEDTSDGDVAVPAEVEQEEPPKTPPKPATPPGPKVHKPIDLYVPKKPEEKVPPPSTVDGKYIAQHLGSALTLALAEIAEKRPWDPIEFLAKWLYKYHENTVYTQKKEALLKDIRDHEAKLNEEEILKFKRQEELRRFQEDEVEKRRLEEEERKRAEQEELQRSAKEAALAQKPQLPTVTEEGEEEEDEDPSVKDRDENGFTEMHKLASQQGIDLAALIDLGYSIADRTTEGKTVRDIALEANQKDTVAAIDNYVKKMLEEGKTDVLEQLAVEGFEGFETMSETDTPEATKSLLSKLNDIKEQTASAFKSVEVGDEDKLKKSLKNLPKLAQAKDKDGRSLLHLAVLARATPIVKYLASNFPDMLKARDSVNRVPLHYAAGVSDELTQILLSHGANKKVKDAMKRSPHYYSDNKTEIRAIQEKLGLLPPSSEQPQIPEIKEPQNDDEPGTTGVSEELAPATATTVTEPQTDTTQLGQQQADDQKPAEQ